MIQLLAKENDSWSIFLKTCIHLLLSVPGISLLLVWKLCVRKTKGENWKATIVKSVKMWVTVWANISPSK